MGLILDSRVGIAAERRGETAERLLQRVLEATKDQEAALSAIGFTELVMASTGPTPRNGVRAGRPSSTTFSVS